MRSIFFRHYNTKQYIFIYPYRTFLYTYITFFTIKRHTISHKDILFNIPLTEKARFRGAGFSACHHPSGRTEMAQPADSKHRVRI